jgi:hypothetical protein
MGFLIKTLLKSAWHTLTFTALGITAICFSFYINGYTPIFKIIVPDNFVGEVRLLVTKDKGNAFNLNNFGIGYINQKTFKNGFRPIVIKAGKDISEKIHAYETVAYTTLSPSKWVLEYVSFKIPGKKDSLNMLSFEDLIKLNAIDTSRLIKR